MTKINDMRCWASEIVIKMAEANEPLEEKLIQLKLLKSYIDSWLKQLDKNPAPSGEKAKG